MIYSPLQFVPKKGNYLGVRLIHATRNGYALYFFIWLNGTDGGESYLPDLKRKVIDLSKKFQLAEDILLLISPERDQ